MNDQRSHSDRTQPLPEYLAVLVRRGVLDEITARRIELYRITRGDHDIYSAEFTTEPTDPDQTFDNFLRCRGNSFALDLAITVASKSPSQLPYNPIYIYGDVGLGKTHLLNAIANSASEKSLLKLNTADLELELDRALRLGKRAELRRKLTSADILLVDDIQLCEGRDEFQRDLFSILNHMTRSRRWVVITSDVPPTELAGIEKRLLSRLAGGVIVGLQMGDREERSHFVRQCFGEQEVPDEVVTHLAEFVTDNFRRLKAVVTRLLAASELTHEDITLEAARLITDPSRPPVEKPTESDITEPPPDSPPSTAAVHHEIASPEDAAESPTMGDLWDNPLYEPPSHPSPRRDLSESTAIRFKEMLAEAETEAEQALALQIALGERIRQLRKEAGESDSVKRLEEALALVREGKTEEAVRLISS
jgi:hypothetical protein